MKNIVLFCCGLSGSGKSYFVENILPRGMFYKLKSATTRPMRATEQQGREYYFVDEKYFDTTPLVTRLWVNQVFWTPGKPKWLYGVPECEVMNNLGRNFVYDVIQPKYARQMRDWFVAHGLDSQYEFKTLYFIPPADNFKIARERANMPDDNGVRTTNTCDPIDFLHADLDVDFMLKSSASETIIPTSLQNYLNQIKMR
ncbi:MAG: hypothetical protein K2M34_04370 [Alphaproteobacteria bacterium]|nr:hypothetical protein [Alphaproteobacteria bacterium]